MNLEYLGFFLGSFIGGCISFYMGYTAGKKRTKL